MPPVRGTLASAQSSARRAVRVARALADPDTREPYAEELKNRLRRQEPTGPGADTGEHRCLICGSRRQNERKLAYTRDPSKTCRVRVCGSCGYVHMPGHVVSRYRAKTDIEQLPAGHPRLGTMEIPGREFHMAKMGVDILGGAGHDVLMFGAGRSLDNHHIARLPQVRRVAVSDIMKVRDDAEFIDANDPPRRRFSVVIASEVIEHFRDPHADFAKLFRLVKRNGLVVCGTNVYDGGRLESDRYIYYPDHTSYYTPQVLRRIANRAGVHLDFRAPLLGQGMRKRYVIFSRSPHVMEDVATYFGREIYAPSEVEQPDRPLPQRSHQSWRVPGATTSEEQH